MEHLSSIKLNQKKYQYFDVRISTIIRFVSRKKINAKDKEMFLRRIEVERNVQGPDK